jgi:hypothetical protein
MQQIVDTHDQFGNVESDQSVTRTREHPFDRRVDRANGSADIDGKDGIPHRVEDRFAAAFAVDKASDKRRRSLTTAPSMSPVAANANMKSWKARRVTSE